jgi:hypothetical protein
MGLHAWTRVLTWLRGVEAPRWRSAAAEREAVIAAAVAAAAPIVASQRAGLTDAGRAVLDRLRLAIGP